MFALKNWENDIMSVCVEACDCSEDPLGYRAVFFSEGAESDSDDEGPAFIVGASFLVQRHENLLKSGYNAPMTGRAIEMIENKIGHGLRFKS